MGIGWFRMRPKRNVVQEELARLIDLQAEAFQNLPSMWSTDHIEPCELHDEQTVRRFERQYGDSSRALQELLEFPVCDPATGTPTDDPDLEFHWRVYPITRREIFPLQWRLQAHRTFLADSLPRQLGQWKDWLTAVRHGSHQSYLLDLYLHETTISLDFLFQELKWEAQDSVSQTGRWATKPKLAAVRDQIFSFQVPDFFPAPLVPLQRSELAVDLSNHPSYQSISKKVEELIRLTRSWDANVKGTRKLRYYENYYMTFAQFLDQANDKWLHDFLRWVEACCCKEMGLFLDY